MRLIDAGISGMLAALLLAFGCGHNSATVADSEFADAAPTADAFTLSFEDGTDASPAARAQRQQATAAVTHSLIAGPAKAELAQLNQLIGSVIGSIESGLQDKSTQLTKGANKHVWVSNTKQGLNLRFTIIKVDAAQFGWLGEAKKVGEPETAYREVLHASLLRDGTVPGSGRGTGTLAIDLDAHAAAALGTSAALTGQGQILAGFRHGPKGTHHRFSLRNFTADPAKAPRLSRYFDVVHAFAQPASPTAAATPSRVWTFAGGQQHLADALAALGAADDPAVAEKFHARVRNLNGVGGWSSAVAFAGNFPANTALFARECWGASGAVTYRRAWSCNYPGDLINLATIDFKNECTLTDANAGANVGGDPSNDTTDRPNELSNFDAMRASCFAGAATAEKLFAASPLGTEAAADLASQKYASADNASLINGSIGPGFQNGLGAIIGGSSGQTPPPPSHIVNICPACHFTWPPSPTTPYWQKAYTEHLGKLVGTNQNPFPAPAASAADCNQNSITGIDSGVPVTIANQLVFLFGDARQTSSSQCPKPGETFPDPQGLTASVSLPPGGALPLLQPSWPTTDLQIPGVITACDSAPMDAIELGGKTYLFYKTTPDTGVCRSDPTARKWMAIAHTTGANFNNMVLDNQFPSPLPPGGDQTGGNWDTSSAFQIVSVVKDPDPKSTTLWIFGTGVYRAFNISLAKVDVSTFTDPATWRYYQSGGSYTSDLNQIAPLVAAQCAGEISVRVIPDPANPAANLWMMAYNCNDPLSTDQYPGRNLLLRTASAPAGPWSDPISLLDPSDPAGNYFIHQPSYKIDRKGNLSLSPDDGLSQVGECGLPGPSKGRAPCQGVGGAAYGPYLLPSYFTTNADGSYWLYYTLQSWNPYTVHLMRTRLCGSGAQPQPQSVSCAAATPAITAANWITSGNSKVNQTSGRVTANAGGSAYQDFLIDSTVTSLSFTIAGNYNQGDPAHRSDPATQGISAKLISCTTAQPPPAGPPSTCTGDVIRQTWPLAGAPFPSGTNLPANLDVKTSWHLEDHRCQWARLIIDDRDTADASYSISASGFAFQ